MLSLSVALTEEDYAALMTMLLSYFHAALYDSLEGTVDVIESILEQDRFYLDRKRTEVEILFLKVTHDTPEIPLFKAKNVTPITDTHNPSRETSALLDENIL